MNDSGAGDEEHDDSENRERWFEEARRKVRLPGLLLLLFGALTVGLSVMYGTLCAINSEGMVNGYYDWIEKEQLKQPPEQRQKLPPRQEAIDSTKVQGPIYGIVGTIFGVLTFLGGSKMRSLSSYTLSMIGSVVSILPGFCCCCVGAIPGIWALVVLLNSDVKLAFARTATGETGT